MALIIIHHYDDICRVLKEYGEYSVPSFLQSFFLSLEEAVGVEGDQLRFLFCCLLAYPLGFFFRLIPGRTAKHLYSIFFGIWMGNLLVSSQWIHTLILSLACYGLLLAFGPKAKLPIALFAMSYLAGLHVYRQWTAYLSWTFDVTMQLMIVVQKLTSIGYNLHDGTSNKNPTPDQKKYSINNIPSLLEFLGWVYLPSNFTLGPFFEFNEYMEIVEDKVPKTNFIPALKILLISLICLVINQVGSLYFPISLLKDEHFLSQNPLSIQLVCLAVAWVARYKYYFGFKVAEGAAVMAGLGFSGKDSKTNEDKWDGMSNMNITRFELSKSFRDSSNAWNTRTSLWLRRLVYDRIPRPYNLYAVYATSAVWHGFYPGYYLFFIMIGLLTNVNRTIHEHIGPLFLSSPPNGKFIYKWLSWFITLVSRDYFILSFMLLSWEDCYRLYRSLGFWQHILGFIAIAVCFVVPKKQSSGRGVGGSSGKDSSSKPKGD